MLRIFCIARSAIDLGRFIQRRIDPCQRRQIDDSRIAGVLPDPGPDIDAKEKKSGLPRKLGGVKPKRLQTNVDHPRRGAKSNMIIETMTTVEMK
jgi:hypothetical protein